MTRPLKIAITGPESTGKSTLAEGLASHYNTLWVPEFAREYINQLNRPYNQNDILEIAKGQIKNESFLFSQIKNFLFCDTELMVTKIWSEVKYNSCDPWIMEKIAQNHYDLFLLCNIDLPWADDPQREHPHMRKLLFDLYLNEITKRELPFVIISGIDAERLKNAIKAVNDFFDF